MANLDPTMQRVQNLIASEMTQEFDYNWPSPEESMTESLYTKPAMNLSWLDSDSDFDYKEASSDPFIPHVGQPQPYGQEFHFPRPHRDDEEKGPWNWTENLAADMWGIVKGLGLTFWEGGKAAVEIARNIEHLPMIFNKTLPYEAQSHSWLTDSVVTRPVFDWIDDFQVGREIRFTMDAIGDCFTNTYKDGLVEALYHHPFTVFLDATAVASLLGKSIVSASAAAGRAARVSARTQFVSKISKMQGATPERVASLAKVWDKSRRGAMSEAHIRARGGKIAKTVANSPYIFVKAPFSIPHNALISGALKRSKVGKGYSDILTSIAKTPRAQKLIGMWGSAMGMMRTEVQVLLTNWRTALGANHLTARGRRLYWNNYNQINLVVPEMARLIKQGKIKPGPVTDAINDLAKRQIDDVGIDGKTLTPDEIAHIKKASDYHRNYALKNQEAAFWNAGWLLGKDEMTKTRAHSFLVAMADDGARAQIQKELLEVISQRGKTEKGGLFGLYGEDVLPKARRDAIHAEYRDKFTNIEFDGSTGSQALAEMVKILKQVEKGYGKAVVPYAPYIAERTMDTLHFADMLTDKNKGAASQGIGSMKKRYGDAVVDLDPHTVYYKHVTRGMQVKHTLRAMRNAFFDYKKTFPIHQVKEKGREGLGVAEADGYRRVMPMELWEAYFNNEDLVRTSVATDYTALNEAAWRKYRDIKDSALPVAEELVAHFGGGPAPAKAGFWVTNEGKALAKDMADGIEWFDPATKTKKKYYTIDKDTPDGFLRHLAGLDAARASIRNWGASVDHLHLTDDLHSMWNKMLSNDKKLPPEARLGEYATYMPEDVYRVIQLQLQSLTGGGGFLARGMSGFLNTYRFMALNMHPRFYINSTIGNAILTLFSGSWHSRYKAAQNVSYQTLPEGMQNILNQDPNRFIAAQFRRSGFLRGVLDKSTNLQNRFAEAVELGPRLRTMAVGAEEFIANDRLLRGMDGPRIFEQGVDVVLEGLTKSMRRVMLEGANKTEMVRQYLDDLGRQTAEYEKLTGLLAGTIDLVDTMKSATGTKQGRAYVTTAGEVWGRVDSIVEKMKQYGITDKSKFVVEWKKLSAGNRMTSAAIYKFMEYLGHPGKSRALSDVATTSGRIAKVQIYTLLRELRESLNGSGGLLEKLNKAKYADEFIRSTDSNTASLLASAGKIDLNTPAGRTLQKQRVAYQTLLEKRTRKIGTIEKEVWDYSPQARVRELQKMMDELTPTKADRYNSEAMKAGISYMEEFFGNYNSMHPIEKRLVRNIYPFWTFPKTMAMLMFKLPGLRPMTTKLMSMYSEFLLSGLDPNEIDSRLGNSLVVGSDENANLILLRYGSWNPFEGAKLMRIGNVAMWPEGLNPINASPLLKVVLETFYGRTAWTGGPVEWGAFRSGTGEIMEPDPTHPGRLRMRLPQRPFVESVMTNLLPHYRIYKEFVDPNYRVRPIPGSGGKEFPYHRDRWWALMRLFGMSIDIKNPMEIQQRDMAYKMMLIKRIRAAYRWYGEVDRAMAEKVIEVVEENNANHDNWMFNPKY